MSFIEYGKLRIPEQLVHSQEDSNLVIFAGAGISMGSPANLPDFPSLVKQICSTLPYEDTEPLERVLGRHFDAGVDVHALAKALTSKKMAREDSGCTDLHRNIPRLFKRGDTVSVRVVTTNFDTFLSKAMPEIKYYSAPALPLGEEFTGLVYLHGSIDDDANSLVLTDRDFSRAYMTEGWAREFMLNLYEKYTVLFIGYSHKDQLISYLARGMNLRNKKVYAFSGDSEDALANWDHLGITAIPFPDGNFKLLGDGVRRWADEEQSDYFQRKEKFTRIVELGIPAPDSENEGFLKKYFMIPGLIEDFTRKTKSSAWCKWVIENGLADFIHDEATTDDMFSVVTPWDGSMYYLGHWLAKHFVRDTRELNRALKKNGHGLSWPLAHALIQSLRREKVSSETSLGYLCTVLFTHCSHIMVIGSHTELLEVCVKHRAYKAALIVLRELLKPRIGMGLYFPDSSEDTNLDVGTIEFNFSSNMLLKYCFEEGKEFTETCSREIFDLCINTLHSIEEMKQGALERAPFSWIEVKDVKYSDDASHGSLATIAYLAVGCMENMLEAKQTPNSLSFASYLAKSQSPIVRRIAVHLLTFSSGPDFFEKLDWLRNSDLIFSYPEYHEVFMLIHDLLFAADENIRSSFCSYLDESFSEKLAQSEGNSDAYLMDYYIHLAYFLNESILDSEVLRELYRIAQEATGLMPSRPGSPEYPTDWRETEEYFKSEFRLKPLDELIQLASSLSIDMKAEYLSQLMIVIQRNTEKALKVLEILNTCEGTPDVNVMRAVLGSIAVHGISSDPEYKTYLDLINSKKFSVPFHISEILSVKSRASHTPLSNKYLLTEFKVCVAFWEAEKSGLLIDSSHSILGMDACFSFMSSILCRIVVESNDAELTSAVLQFLEKIIESREETYISLFRGLGTDLFKVFESNPAWTESYLIPLFSPSYSSLGVASALWEGFFSIVNSRQEEMKLLQPALIESLGAKIISTDTRNFHQMVLKRLFSNHSKDLEQAMVITSDDRGLCMAVIHIRYSKELKADYDLYWNAWVKDYFVGRLKSQVKSIKRSEFTEILLLAIENPTVYEDLKIMLEAYSGELGKRAVAFVNASRESEFHLRNPFLASKYLSKMVALTGYSDHKNGKLIVNFVEEILHARSESFITLLPVLELLGRTGIPDAKVVYEKYIGCNIDA